MSSKITYSVVIGHAGRPNRFGTHLVQIQAYQNRHSLHFSTGIHLAREQFRGGIVVGHPLARQYNAYLYKMRNDIEAVELEMILRGQSVSLAQLRDAYLRGISTSAPIAQFCHAVIDGSDRCRHTKSNYHTLLRDLDAFQPTATLAGIDYEFVARFHQFLRARRLAHNTVTARLRSLRALVNEAVKRRLISSDDSPFLRFRIPSPQPRKVMLTPPELRRVARLELSGRKERIRDAFLFASYTGLRYSDLVTLKTEHFVGDLIVKPTVKTGRTVRLPYRTLFGGSILPLIEKYGSVEQLLAIGHNATANRTLQSIVRDDAHIPKHITFHAARHYFATQLNSAGLQMQEIQQLLGHDKLETTSQIYADTDISQLRKAIRKAFRRNDEKELTL